MTAVKTYGVALKYESSGLREHKNLILGAIESNQQSFAYNGQKIKKR